jgi:hypothetical protein
MTVDTRPVILVVGDSFTVGQGCTDRDDPATQTFPMIPSEFAWSTLLSRDLPNYNVINLAQPGSSNITICKQVHDYVGHKHKKKPELILFCSSFDGRIIVQSDPILMEKFGDVIGLTDWVIPAKNLFGASKDYANAKQMFVKHLLAMEYFGQVSLASVWSIYGVCNRLGIKFAWSYPEGEDANIDGRLNLLNEYKFQAISDWTFATRHTLGNTYLSSDLHANNLGHQGYYKEVIKPLIDKIL